MRDRAQSELNLLHFYYVGLCYVIRVSRDNLGIHAQSVELLRDYSHCQLNHFIPSTCCW